jgi:hypothetical protein
VDENFRPILGRGENYIFSDESRPGLPGKDKRPSFELAKERLKSNIQKVKTQIHSIPNEHKLNEIVVNLKMELGYTAKSYHPNNFIKQAGIKDVGTKKWEKKEVTKNGVIKISQGKDIFLRLSEKDLFHIEELLNRNETTLTKGFIDDVRTMRDLYVTDNEELLTSFNSGWRSGRVEIVLHPFGDLEEDVESSFINLLKNSGGDPSKIKVRSYSPGPTFISAYLERHTLERIVKFNPVRTVHPLNMRNNYEKGGTPTNFNLPTPPSEVNRSSITVGVFDGGIIPENPMFKGFANENMPILDPQDNEFLQHGTSVVGAILYGDLKRQSTLPVPSVNVESFRVFPLSDKNDYDLYEVIDQIEEIVPNRRDIKVFNLSIGPYGPIEDDYISRFTYVIDKLSQNGERLFVVAVGNDGDLKEDSDRRIQSPSDTINGLGVGAYTLDSDQQRVRAPYSCIGEGREGAKVKPDITEYGGCSNSPFHLINVDGKTKHFDSGTSFAAPLVSRKAAELVGRCNLVDPLVAKALIINSADHPNKQFDRYLGYGALPDSVENILACSNNKITVLFRQKILPKKYARLEIPVVKDLDYKGKVDIHWTIAVATKPNPLNSDDYTSCCIEDFFYPNISDYVFRSPDSKRNLKRNLINDRDEIEELLNQEWKKGKYPASKSGTKYLNEQERRANFKWDSVVKKGVSVNYDKLKEPYLVLHAMDRYLDENISDFFDYSVVVTIDYRDYKGDAYRDTIQNFNQLEMAKIRNVNEILVK